MRCTFLAVLLLAVAAVSAAADTLFESAHVHPLEMSPDGSLLLAVNTDDHRLSVFTLNLQGVPDLIAEVPVGLEPVTVRARTNTEAWVVNHISDSISIVDLVTMHVIETLAVGDEPTDVVFADGKAFVAISQDDMVKVYDAASPGPPLAELLLEGSDPRSLAVHGGSVYVTVLDGQNRTTLVPEAVVSATLGLPAPNPPMAGGLPAAPGTGLIVRHDGGSWVDELSRSWDFALPYTMPDKDVFEIDVATMTVTDAFTSVGTTLFNVAVNPATGALVVTNQEAINEVRFEPNLEGRFVQSRVSFVDPVGAVVTPVHLNTHIDYANPSGDAGERSLSLGIPLDVTVSSDGAEIYVAAFGSAKVGVLDAAGSVIRRIQVGNGPSGLVLDENRNRLYVLSRFDNAIRSVIPTGGGGVDVTLGFDPTPSDVREGRRVFYDTVSSSAHGDLSCASCHVFMGMDNMSWDLGDPQGSFQAAPPGQLGSSGFHPMKGPMATQSLKGLTTSEPFHWRGDRENLAAFNGAFVSLLGRSAELSAPDFALFETFVTSVEYPPNPNRNLDGSLPDPTSGPNPADGEALFLTGNLVGGLQCVTCHSLPTGENGLIIPAPALQEPQDMVVPQLRNMYEKTRFDNTASSTVRGFGYTHDGGVDDLFSFLQFPGFTFSSDDDRRDVAAFLLAFDTGTHAAIGAQWTMNGTNEADGTPTLNILETAADASAIGLIAKGRSAGENRGWLYTGGGQWISDRQSEGTLTRNDLLAIAGPGSEITFTAVVTGCETRLGIDRDGDGFLDRDELDAGSSPSDPSSTPSTVTVGDPAVFAGALLDPAYPNPASFGSGASIAYSLDRPGPMRLQVFDVRGGLVRSLIDDRMHTTGRFERRWDLRDAAGREVAGGLYFYRLTTATGSIGRRVVVIR